MILTFEASEVMEFDAAIFDSVDDFDAAGLAVSPRLRDDEDGDFDEDFGVADDDDDDDDDDDETEKEYDFEDDDDF